VWVVELASAKAKSTASESRASVKSEFDRVGQAFQLVILLAACAEKRRQAGKPVPGKKFSLPDIRLGGPELDGLFQVERTERAPV